MFKQHKLFKSYDFDKEGDISECLVCRKKFASHNVQEKCSGPNVRFEFVRKHPGFKFSVSWGLRGSLVVYVGTKTHPFGKVYVFRDSND